MNRAEATGFGVAMAGHLALLGALSLGFASAVRPPIISEPMEVSFVEDIALESAAPSAEAPAAKLAEVEGPVEESLPPPPLPLPEPIAPPQAIRPVPAPRPVPAERPQPAPAKAKPVVRKATPRPKVVAAKARPASKKENARSTGRLEGLLNGLSERPSESRAATPAGKTASAAVKSSLGAEVRRQLKPHWKAPTGADVEQLRTELSITLAPNGAVTNVDVLRTTGQTASNRPQVKLHQEQALRAARLASPFKLSPEYYDAWKELRPMFDKRLSQ